MRLLKYAFALAMGLVAASTIAQAQTVGFATLPAGAINNVQAQVIAKVVQQNSKLKVRVTPYRGTTAVAAAVQKQQSEFGITDVVDLTDALTGVGAFKGRKHPDLRVVFRILAFPVTVFVRKDSPIKTIADLKGKRYPTKWVAFSNGIPMSEAILNTADLGWKDLSSVPVTNIISAANDFKSGKLDSFLFAVGAPKVAEINSAVGGVRALSVGDIPAATKKVKAIRSDYFIIPLKPAPPFAGILGPTNVLGSDLIIYANAKVSDDTVYNFLKSVIGQKSALVKGHPTFRAHVPALMGKQFQTAQYHPGAIKLLKEKGLWKGK